MVTARGAPAAAEPGVAVPEPTTVELLAFALELAELADATTLPHYRSDPEAWRKADGSFVTVADTQTEHELRAHIASKFPEHRILGEEEGQTLPPMPTEPSAEDTSTFEWVLDPIDGTHNFMRG
ncbi:MAG: hypothetical protein DWI48_07070, partial [Chloroflexi bacterium]